MKLDEFEGNRSIGTLVEPFIQNVKEKMGNNDLGFTLFEHNYNLWNLSRKMFRENYSKGPYIYNPEKFEELVKDKVSKNKEYELLSS